MSNEGILVEYNRRTGTMSLSVEDARRALRTTLEEAMTDDLAGAWGQLMGGPAKLSEDGTKFIASGGITREQIEAERDD